SLMFFGMMFLLFFVYFKLGGISKAHLSLTALASGIPAGFAKIGHAGWTASPALNTPLWWIIYSSLVLGVGIGVLAQPQLVVRYMTVKSNKELNRAVAVGGLFILATTGTAFIIGSLSNVYFIENFGKLAVQMAEGNQDKVIPIFIKEAMPVWFGYVFMLVILSAGMSTLSSQYHTIGTAIGRDIIPQFKDNKNREILVTRIGIVISILATVFLGIKMGPGIIAQATAIFFGLMASSFLAPYTAALYWRRLTRKGAIAGIVSGVSTSVFCFLFLHGKEAALFGVSKFFTGRDTILGGMWPFVDPLVIALPVSIIFTIVISLVTSVENRETVEKSFRGI
ncbi:MAG TPA: sodium:solute symporter, partial [Actinobacteria bacterium]|nr:sodium:solute symporter [Actinomycetota bacterium]